MKFMNALYHVLHEFCSSSPVQRVKRYSLLLHFFLKHSDSGVLLVSFTRFITVLLF